MDAYLCKLTKDVPVNHFEDSQKDCNGQSKLDEPPLKKLKKDNCVDENNHREIIVIDTDVASGENKDKTVQEKDKINEQHETTVIKKDNDNMEEFRENTSSEEDKSKNDEIQNKKDDVSPPKQKRRKLTNEEKEAQMKQKEEARILREKMQLEKQLEKEKKEKEKEALRLKKEKEKHEKQAKKEQLEKERLERQKKKEEIMQAKEEERRKREEERKQKEEERKQKEEEKRKVDEEKRLKDEEELRKKERVKTAFRSFFIKKTPPKKIATVGEECKLFKPFELKPNMTLAPLCRGKRVEDKSKFDEQCETQGTSELYLLLLKNRCSNNDIKYITKRDLKTEDDSTDVNKEAEEDVIVTSSTNSPCKDPPIHKTMRVKLLQFCENHRPAYYGTWRKRSKSISARNPLKKDEDHLNYEIDSDEEWEEEEPGESLSGPENDDEEEDDNDDDEDDDGFFVPHGYLSDDEGINESDGEKEEEKVDIKDRKLDKTEGFPFDKKGKTKQMRAVCFGSSWFISQTDVPDFLNDFKIYPMMNFPIDVFEVRQKDPVERKSPTQNAESAGSVYRGSVPMRVPEEAMHLLINHVHKSSFGLNKLIITFLDFWKSRQPKDNEATMTSYPQISKRQLERKILEIAKRDVMPDTNKSCYIVHQNILEKYAEQLETHKNAKEEKPELTKITSPKTPSRVPRVSPCHNGFNSSDGDKIDNKIRPFSNDMKSPVFQNGDNLPSNDAISDTSLKPEIIII